MRKNIVRIFVIISLIMSMTAACSAQVKIYCFFDTSDDQFQWYGCFNEKYYSTLFLESSNATDDRLVLICNKYAQKMMSEEWRVNRMSLNQIARKHGYDYVMKIYVMKPTEDVVHFRTARYQKDYYDVLGIPMVCVLADNKEGEWVIGGGGGGTQTHGLLSRENAWYVSYINQIRGVTLATCKRFRRPEWCDPNLADLTKEEEKLIEEYGKYW